MHARWLVAAVELHRNVLNGEWVTKGNKVACAFYPLNGRDTSHTENVTFGRMALFDQFKNIGTHGNKPACLCLARGVDLLRDVHHFGLAVLVEMTERRVHQPYDKTMALRAFRKTSLYWAAVLSAAWLVGLLPSPASAQTRVGTEQLPQLGEADADGLSLAAERRLGRQVLQEFLRAGVVADDPELEDYLSAQSARLLQAALSQGHLRPGQSIEPAEFRFFAVRDPAINAFALPGGFIGIHTGLLAQSQSESELMSVLAHEIGHVSQRHISRQFGQRRQSSAVMIAAALLAAMAASSSSDAAMGIMSLGQTVAVQDRLSFSRDAEREADRVGLGLLHEAGFNPQAMVSLFQKLLRAGEFYDSAAPNWVRSHPLTSERIADVQTRISQLSPSQSAVSRQFNRDASASDRVQDTLEFRWLKARIGALSDRSVDGLARSQLRLQKAFDQATGDAIEQSALAYAMAWVAASQRRHVVSLNWLDKAEKFAQLANTQDWAEPLLVSARVETLMAAGQLKRALDVLQSGLDAASSSISQRQLARLSIRLVDGLGRHDQALSFAQSYTSRWPDDLQGWALQAQAASAANKQTYAHWATAERYQRAGALKAALEQLQLARKANDADFAVMSIIDARMATLRREIQFEKSQSQSLRLTKP
jgi:predicted Zn-dependent protease